MGAGHCKRVETFLSVCLGIGLAAACGFRVFVPLLCLSIAAHTGFVDLIDSFAWIGSMPAVIAFAVATALEIAAYYLPWVDNALDTAAVPIATIAGILVTASVVTDVAPLWRWTLAVLAGGGIAASTQVATTKARAASSLTTAGFGNPIVSTAEAGISSVLSVVSVLWPIVAMVLVIVLLALCFIVARFIGKRVFRLFRSRPESDITPTAPS